MQLLLWDRRSLGHIHPAIGLGVAAGAVSAFVQIVLVATNSCAPIARHLPGV